MPAKKPRKIITFEERTWGNSDPEWVKHNQERSELLQKEGPDTPYPDFYLKWKKEAQGNQKQ